MLKSSLFRCAALAALFTVLLFTTQPVAGAQVLFGSIVGSVTDPSGAAVPAAMVKITETQTNETREAVTNQSGAYSFPAIPAGTYNVEIQKQGFDAALVKDIVVHANTVVRADAALQVGAVTQNVQVEADAAVLQTDSADVRQEINAKALDDLPLPA